VLYLSAAESPQYAANEAEHARVGGALLGALLGRRRAVRQREAELAAVYRRLFEAWRLYITGVASAAPAPLRARLAGLSVIVAVRLYWALRGLPPLLRKSSLFCKHGPASEMCMHQCCALHPTPSPAASAAPCAGARKAEQACALGGFGGFAGRLGMRKSTGMVRSSYEEEQVVLQLQAVELMKAMCKARAPAAPRRSARLRVGMRRCGA